MNPYQQSKRLLRDLLGQLSTAEDHAGRVAIFLPFVRSYLVQEEYDETMARFSSHLCKTLVSSFHFGDSPNSSLIDVFIDELESGEITSGETTRTLPLQTRIRLFDEIESGAGAPYDRPGLYRRQYMRAKMIVCELHEKAGDTTLASQYRECIERELKDEAKVAESIAALEKALEDNSLEDASKAMLSIKALFPLPDRDLDAKFRWLSVKLAIAKADMYDAVTEFQTLSTHDAVSPEKQLEALEWACMCSLLDECVEAGVSTLRGLRDTNERMRKLDIFDIVNTVCDSRMLTSAQIEKLHKVLPPSLLTMQTRRSKRPNFTLATFGHQLLAISHLYENISYENLAKLTNTEKEDVGDMVADLLSNGRSWARIDQPQELIWFPTRIESRVDRYPLVREWDRKILGLTTQVERAAGLILDQQESVTV